MRNLISAIIIDKDYLQHDYARVKTDAPYKPCEEYFGIKIFEDDSNILNDISDFRGVDAIITVGGEFPNYMNMMMLPFEYRKRWVHMPEFNADAIANAIVATFKANVSRDCPEVFSVFTCTYRTGKEKLDRLYFSLLEQTYREWNWFIIDDSNDNGETVELLKSYNDPRIVVIQNVTNHGSIGFNKHTIAMMCSGDYLVEVDHDDELAPDCFEILLRAFHEYPDTDFAYSLAAEFKGPNGDLIIYGEGWGHGEGNTKTEIVKGKMRTFSSSPNINPYTIRTIFAMPNHVRCWKRDFYHKIGGHNMDLAVLDDMELIIRTFLYGKMTRIDKVLYYQYEDAGERGVSQNNTQSSRFGEIQRTVWLLKDVYDRKIHDRILELGFEDDPWNEEYQTSQLWKEHEPNQNVMNNELLFD